MTQPIDTRFFVVRNGVGGKPSYSIEHDDFSSRYDKRNMPLYRTPLCGSTMTLAQLTTAYEKGWRAKPVPVVKVVEPKTFNSVLARHIGRPA